MAKQANSSQFDNFDRVEKSIVRYGNDNFKAAGRLCQISRRIYNRANYIMRHEMFDGKKPQHSDADKLLKKGALYESDQLLYKKLYSSVSQRITQMLGADWASFYAALKDYKQSPEKYKARPKPPGYGDRAKSVYIPRSAFKVVDGYIHFSKALGLKPISVARLADSQPVNAKASATTIKEVRIIPTGNCYVFEVVYDSLLSRLYSQKQLTLLDKNKRLFIDIGINNLACLVSDQPGYRPVLINGKTIKSINAKYNKDCAQLRSLGKKKHLSSKSMKRACRIRDYLHRAARFIVNQCLEHDLGVIVIGLNRDWKQGINIGKVNNQNFTSIPHAVFIAMIEYKAREYGIEVRVREESYTSKASAIDVDPIPTYGKTTEKPSFSGRRVKRGLYKSKNGVMIGADVNGAINIGRKEFGDDFVQGLLDSGCVFQPRALTLHKRVPERSKALRKIRSGVIHSEPSLAA